MGVERAAVSERARMQRIAKVLPRPPSPPGQDAIAQPSGRVSREAWDKYAGRILGVVRAEKDRADGVLLALHGAMVSTLHDDGEAALLREVRTIVGPEVPICVTLDLHANLSGCL